ncbi:MAG: ferredoxin [Pseudomonadota bacterium]
MTPSLDHIKDRARTCHLQVLGQSGVAVLLGPLEPNFWQEFTSSPEWQDGAPHPMDRWSERVISGLADEMGATALFPFGPNQADFLGLALNSTQTWQSPVGMLVHDQAGLMVSFRGALVFDQTLPETELATKPCDACDRPCEMACPVQALTPPGYDGPKCKEYLATVAGKSCLTSGCLVRRACPVSQKFGRAPEQSGYHMRQFLG